MITLRKIDEGLKIWPPIRLHGYEFYITPDPHHRGKIWIENQGEGMQVAEKSIPFPFRGYAKHTGIKKSVIDKWWGETF